MHEAASGPCRNCGAELTGPFCADCGQRAVALRPSLHELLHEAGHELLHFDGKILRTAGLLFFRPGQLTREFLDGMRVRSVTPIRIYLLCSLLFFGVLGLLPNAPLKVTITKGADAQLERAARQANRDPSILSHALEAAFPKAMFVLTPLFGLLVYAMYFRTERMYVPHFYFAVHYHAVAFALLAVVEATTPLRWIPIRIARAALILALFPYLTISLRRVYDGGRLLTYAKAVAILVIYAVCILLTMAAIAFVTLRRL
jgi:hypothetical protein